MIPLQKTEGDPLRHLIREIQNPHRYRDDILRALENVADLNDRDDMGYPPIFYAIFQDDVNVVKTLVENGADVNILSDDRTTPLMAAADGGSWDIAQYLLDTDADIHKKNTLGQNALLYVRDQEQKHVNTVKLLLDSDIEYDYADRNGLTPLMSLARWGHFSAVSALLMFGVNDINQQDKDGYSALSHAVEGGRFEMLKTLLSHGADMRLRTKNGKNIFDLIQNDQTGDSIKEVLESLLPDLYRREIKDIAKGTVKHLPRKKFGGFKK